MLVVETQIIFGVIFACLIILMLIAFFMVLVVVYQKKLRKRQEENFQAIIDAEEKERSRVARELHDSLGASLSAIKLHYDSVQEQILDPNRASLIHTMLNDACAEVRSISHQMLPQILIQQGFFAALEAFCSPLKKIDGITFELVLMGKDDNIIEASKALMLYRIAQELVSNSFKHSGASHILLQAMMQKDHINIIMEDDGIGFDPAIVNSSTGLGLSSLKSRVQFLKGSLNIMPAPNKGIHIMVSVPLKA